MARTSARVRTTGSLAGRRTRSTPGMKASLRSSNLLVEEKKAAQGMVLSRSGDCTINGEMIEERCDLFFIHLLRMAFVMEKNETPDPVHLGLLGANAVVLQAKVPADAVEQFGTL